MSVIFRHPIAFVFAVLLHALLAFALLQNIWSFKQKPAETLNSQAQEVPVTELESNQQQPMKTFTVDQAQVERQVQLIRDEELRKRNEQKYLEQQTKKNQARLAELKKQQEAEQRMAEQARKDAEIARLKKEAELERAVKERREAENARKLAQEMEQKKLAEEARLKELQKLKAEAEKLAEQEQQKQQELAEESRRLAAQTLQQRLLAEQEEAQALANKQAAEAEAKVRAERKQQEMENLRETYKSAISAKVRENYRTPAEIAPEAQCEIEITQTPTGSVSSVKVENCNAAANEQFKKAAESAVLRAQPLPAPPVEELFERRVRFIFRP